MKRYRKLREETRKEFKEAELIANARNRRGVPSPRYAENGRGHAEVGAHNKPTATKKEACSKCGEFCTLIYGHGCRRKNAARGRKNWL